MKIKRLLFCLALASCAPIALAQAPAVQGAAPAAKPQSAQAKPTAPLPSQADIERIVDLATLQRLAAGFGKTGDMQRLTWVYERLSTLFPNSGDYKFALAVLHAQKGEKTETYDLLMRLKQQGFGYDIKEDKRFAKVSDTKLWTYVVDNLKANLATFGEGKVAFELPKGDTLYESLAWDAKRSRLLVGSARDGSIQIVDAKGKLTPFIKADAQTGLWSVYGLAADAERDLLYVASTSSTYFKGFKQDDFGKAAVFKFQLSSGKLLERYAVTGEGVHTLSTITVGKGGQMFAADGLRNRIYTIDGNQLKLVVSDPNLHSVRGLAVSDDGKLLFFADYQLGLFGVHLATGKGFAVGYNVESLVLGGIDGLYWYDGTLVVVENGMRPQRVMRLSLSPDGRSISKVMPLDVANAAFSLPTYGAVAGEKLYFIANSQKGLYGQYGTVKDGAELKPVRVFESNLRFAWNEAGINTARVPVRQAPFSEGKQLMQTPPSLTDPSPRIEPAPEPKPDAKKGD